MKSPKAPKPTAADVAMIARQGRQLDEEMAKNEKRLKAVARGGLGTKSLLGTAKQAAAKQVQTADSASPKQSGLPSKSLMSAFRGYR
jgi:phosphoglycerate dehydrogenase-like enzyme